ncbi:MAG: DNA alkylation repair protein, partial [Pseudomonadota bacterium]
SERDHLSEWLMANQLMKAKPLVELLQSWEEHPIPLLRRLFWYHQARLRWTGQPSPENTPELVAKLEDKFATEDPMVQWTMNFCAAWIGVHQTKYRDRCVALGQKTGLYKELKAPKNCTPMYLPAFIKMEAAKRNL